MMMNLNKFGKKIELLEEDIEDIQDGVGDIYENLARLDDTIRKISKDFLKIKTLFYKAESNSAPSFNTRVTNKDGLVVDYSGREDKIDWNNYKEVKE